MTTKTTQAITQLVADGVSEEINLSAIDQSDFSIVHQNSSGTAITTPATVALELQGMGSTEWHSYQSVVFSTVESEVEEITFSIPSSFVKARLSYTIPGEGTGATLDAECTMVSFSA